MRSFWEAASREKERNALENWHPKQQPQQQFSTENYLREWNIDKLCKLCNMATFCYDAHSLARSHTRTRDDIYHVLSGWLYMWREKMNGNKYQFRTRPLDEQRKNCWIRTYIVPVWRWKVLKFASFVFSFSAVDATNGTQNVWNSSFASVYMKPRKNEQITVKGWRQTS